VSEFGLPLRYKNVITPSRRAQKHLDPAWSPRFIYAETKFDAREPHSAGAEGLMQLLPETAKFLAQSSGATLRSRRALKHPAVNIACGSY